MSDLSDRRARKKAQTRDVIRSVAQRLFAERGFDAVTIADIAGEADVAVQTVFNHFATKEELFFDERTPWVEGPAAAVRNREPGVPPLTALRHYVVATVRSLVESLSTPERRSVVTTLQRSPSLRAYERELVHEAELKLADALVEAWTAENTRTDPTAQVDLRTAASATAAMWLTTAARLTISQRPILEDGGDPARAAAAVANFADRLLSRLEEALELVQQLPREASTAVTGWPEDVRRLG